MERENPTNLFFVGQNLHYVVLDSVTVILYANKVGLTQLNDEVL